MLVTVASLISLHCRRRHYQLARAESRLNTRIISYTFSSLYYDTDIAERRR